MMQNKHRMICFIILFLLLSITVCFLFLGKKQSGRLIDKTGIIRNSYSVNISNDLINNIFIYWTGENGTRENIKMLIFHKSLLSEIPQSYGANNLIIKYDNHEYNKIGIWKEYAYSTYNYFIDLNKIDSLVISCIIDNWCISKIIQGFHTIRIK